MGSRLRHTGARHWPIALLTVAAAILILTNLGGTYLWEDEGDTAVLARSILQHGVPTAWDGVTFSEPDFGQRLNDDLTMVGHPWLQYYVAALSFAVLGETPATARLPFALAGVAAVPVVYAMVVALGRSRTAGLTAAALLTVNVQYLLFAQQARNYALNMLLTCLLVWQFHRLRSWKRAAAFGALGILLFHAHAIGLAAVAALGVLTLVHPDLRDRRRWFWPAALAIAMYVVPWLVVSSAGTRQNTAPIQHLGQLAPRLLQFVIELSSVTPAVGIAALYIYLIVRRRRSHSAPQANGGMVGALAGDGRGLAVTCMAVIGAEAMVMALTHSRDGMWIIGLHHAPAIIPLAAAVAGLLISETSAGNRYVLGALVLVFACTRFPQLIPWVAWSQPAASRDHNSLVTFHIPVGALDRFVRTTPVQYVKTLTRPNPGVIARISDFLNAHAQPGDLVMTNYSWEALYFHTRLPQAMKIARSFPIYAAARARALPDYVFDTTGVRWIVWRRAWPAAFQEQDCAALLRRLQEEGIGTELVASIPESLFENRENIHFRRWANQRYVFPWYGPLPDTLIFRVDRESSAVSRPQPDPSSPPPKGGDDIARFREYLRAHPDDLAVWAHLGAALADSGEIDQAIPAFRRVAENAPTSAAAQNNMANVLLLHGDPARAEAYARKAVALNPADAAAHDALGRALAAQGKGDEAVEEFERALKVDPANAFARAHLAQIRRPRASR